VGATRPLSIAIITSIAFSLPNFRGPFIRELVARGLRVYALAPDHDAYSREQLSRLGATPVDFKLSRAGMNPVEDALNTFRLALLLRRLKPDIAYSYFIKPVVYGSLAALLAGVPRRFALVAGLGHAFSWQGGRGGLKTRVLRQAVRLLLTAGFKACHGVIFQNEEDRMEFTGGGLLCVEKTLRTRGTGVDLTRLTPLGWPQTPVTFLLAARLVKSKGIEDYAKAAKRVRQIHPESHFILLGNVDANPESMRLEDVRRLVKEAALEWPGHVNDIIPFLERAHVFVLPSYYREGIPRSTQEAMACGRAIITTDNVGCRETVVEGKNGFLVPVKDAEALADAMLKLIRDPDLARKQGQKSRALAEELFNVEGINEQIIAFILGINVA
jgi:glycosyltransferase involved in cell wall biosynthesis